MSKILVIAFVLLFTALGISHYYIHAPLSVLLVWICQENLTYRGPGTRFYGWKSYDSVELLHYLTAPALYARSLVSSLSCQILFLVSPQLCMTTCWSVLYSAYNILKICQAIYTLYLGSLWTETKSGCYNVKNPTVERFDIISNYPVGGATLSMPFDASLDKYILSNQKASQYPGYILKFVRYHTHSQLDPQSLHASNQIYMRSPLEKLIPILSNSVLRQIATSHCVDVSHSKNTRKEVLVKALLNHDCDEGRCESFVAELIAEPGKALKNSQRVAEYRQRQRMASEQDKKAYSETNKHLEVKSIYSTVEDHLEFPPACLDQPRAEQIIANACHKLDYRQFQESGCAVCGMLKPYKDMSRLKHVRNALGILEVDGIARREIRVDDKIKVRKPFSGPVIDTSCDKICNECRSSLRANVMPPYALAKGLWIGCIPKELSDLRYMEKLLVSKARHSCCWIKISTGGRKMSANVITYENPTPKLYAMLPPPREDLEEVLAIMFTGPVKPTAETFSKASPFLVRRNHVRRALEWLKLNHIDYTDITISEDNLGQYPEDMPPVSIEFMAKDSNKSAQNTSVHDNNEEDGVEDGDCIFTVHGITGEDLDVLSLDAIKAKSLHHLNNQGKFLCVGHGRKPLSMWKNPKLYPLMFPHLFPYGLGGIGSVEGLSQRLQKRRLLMYHDKRFQRDVNFPFVAFSHEQMQLSATHGYLLAEKDHFPTICNRLLSLDTQVMNSMTGRMINGEIVRPQTDKERQCWQVFHDLDHVLGKVEGSTTAKKHLRNEVWSLVARCGSPTWYITLSPIDISHPLCIYYAGTEEKFSPDLKPYAHRIRAVTSNPVAAARFFDYMVNIFINEVLASEKKEDGVFGPTSAYYGTVEQQGRLTLHLHMMVWIKGNISPQCMRERILNDDIWREKIVAYLESSYCGEFLSGSLTQVKQNVYESTKDKNYRDPTTDLPVPPPTQQCEINGGPKNNCRKCKPCQKRMSWWSWFQNTVDDILLKSNIHTCSFGKKKDGSKSKKYVAKSCIDNKWKKCRARFPRTVHEETSVDNKTGYITMKKLEQWLNTITPVISYIFGCNTDVTSLLSGTAVKAVIVYVTDYITKPGLTTHVMFDAISSIISKKTEILNGDFKAKEKGRILMTKIINLVSAKMELGAPIISMYLLGNPDHYTDHTFVPFYWQSFVHEAVSIFIDDAALQPKRKVTLIKKDGRFVGLTPVYDYIYRPIALEDLSVYEFAQRCSRVSLGTNKGKGKKMNKSTYLFQPEHPLYESHGLKVLFRQATYCKVVPNFIGPSLPRPDIGEPGEYTSTMLALFKPWRSGKDLRLDDETWMEAYRKYDFPKAFINIMKNLNLKYECLDARDDHRAQLKKSMNAEHSLPEWMSSSHEYQDGDSHESMQYTFDDILNIDECNSDTVRLGRHERHRLQLMQQMDNIMIGLGWHEEVAIKNTSSVSERLELNLASYTTDWKAEIMKKKQLVIDARVKDIPSSSSASNPMHGIVLGENYNQVFVADKSYLCRNKKNSAIEQKIINSTISKFRLNYEQEKAFRIVANHATDPYSERLNMYIGGMGGTGKSQVLKALISFFSDRNESYRLIIVAPTGSAAALLGGMTYHSAFGINDKNSRVNLSAIKSRLIGVEYVFFDEVSMLSAFDMYRISARLCQVLNTPDRSFGGLNMIFAGDFAQLPPAMGGETVSLYGERIGFSGSESNKLKSAIGKSVWHEVTTVVILKQNMRQKGDNEEDMKLLQCLNNLRYKACSDNDIKFLRSRISCNFTGFSSICEPQFRTVSIVTTQNILKDAINTMGTKRFAAERSLSLTDFYSEDRLVADEADSSRSRTKHVLHKTQINPLLQAALWDQPPSCTDKLIAGKLSLCIGLPVMIRNNSATELCITKGQEGHVYGWKSGKGSKGQPILEVLFVELHNPPAAVQFESLPKNVVPILPSTTTRLRCSLQDDTKIFIDRTQVEILPNFAMTDFASQGKTRPFNVVDVQSCRTHQSFYTAISRGTTAQGTLILQNFSAQNITGGIKGYQRQEFRSLELLHEITDLTYKKKLPATVFGTHRRELIASFRKWKGDHYIPEGMHPAIRWNKLHPWLEELTPYHKWQLVDDESKKGIENIAQKQTATINLTGSAMSDTLKLPKRNREEYSASSGSKSNRETKRQKQQRYQSPTHHGPVGTQWQNNSCAYDAVIVILYAIWAADTHRWQLYFERMNNEVLTQLIEAFMDIRNNRRTITNVREEWRKNLENMDPRAFVYGEYVGTHRIYDSLFICPEESIKSIYWCDTCDLQDERTPRNHVHSSVIDVSSPSPSIQEWIRESESSVTRHRCITCLDQIMNHRFYEKSCTLKFVVLFGIDHIAINKQVTFKLSDNREAIFDLKGVIYFGQHHFTSLIRINEEWWYHDGIETGCNLVCRGNIDNEFEFLECRGRKAHTAIYTIHL